MSLDASALDMDPWTLRRALVTLRCMSGGRVYAKKPTGLTSASVPPVARPRSQFAPEPARSVPGDRDGADSTQASPLAIPRHSFPFADIPLHSREERAALERLASSRAAGTELDAETAGFLSLRFGSVQEAPCAVSPPRASLSFPVQAKLEVGAVDIREAVRGDVGRPLDARDRARFEPQLGVDLSRVRIHDEAPASDAARLLGARALTAGSHILLTPRARDDDEVLAHEIAHVAQQASSVCPRGLDAGATDPAEQHADLTAAFLLGRSPQRAAPLARPVPAVQRAIEPEDVSVEMLGRSFELATPVVVSGVTLAAGTLLAITAWDNAKPNVTVTTPTVAAPFDAPKKFLKPTRAAVAGINPYGAGVAGQERVVEKGEADLAALTAKGPKGVKDFAKEKARLEGLLATRRKLLNRKLIQETMLNRFDAVIKREVDAANAARGLVGAAGLDPNLLKALLFQETQIGTSGTHLEVPPTHPVKTRFNLAQVIDSSGMALLKLLEREQPALITAFSLGTLRSELSALLTEKTGLEARAHTKKGLSPTDSARLATLRTLLVQNGEAFIWSYKKAGASVGFNDAVTSFFAATTPGRNFDYEFWIHIAVMWLFEKHRAGATWGAAIKAYNGSGAKANHYRDAILGNASDAAAAASSGTEFVPPGI